MQAIAAEIDEPPWRRKGSTVAVCSHGFDERAKARERDERSARATEDAQPPPANATTIAPHDAWGRWHEEAESAARQDDDQHAEHHLWNEDQQARLDSTRSFGQRHEGRAPRSLKGIRRRVCQQHQEHAATRAVIDPRELNR